ncbi:MAG: ATP-binding protein [Gemmatimonadaceae bacterium]|nr:ATP-binding protein [Gemmatimonadaceae bacterium]
MSPFSEPHPTNGSGGFPIEVSIPSDVRLIEGVVGMVARHCAERDLPPRACNLTVPVALTEALSNAILYGNREDVSKSVTLRATLTEVHLVLEVADEGVGFDIDACTVDPTSPAQLDREDGRGLYLMRTLMDRVERYTDGGNVVRLTLFRQ